MRFSALCCHKTLRQGWCIAAEHIKSLCSVHVTQFLIASHRTILMSKSSNYDSKCESLECHNACHVDGEAPQGLLAAISGSIMLFIMHQMTFDKRFFKCAGGKLHKRFPGKMSFNNVLRCISPTLCRNNPRNHGINMYHIVNSTSALSALTLES